MKTEYLVEGFDRTGKLTHCTNTISEEDANHIYEFIKPVVYAPSLSKVITDSVQKLRTTILLKKN